MRPAARVTAGGRGVYAKQGAVRDAAGVRPLRRRLIGWPGAAVLASCSLTSAPAKAQAYPSRAIRLIVPFAVGGTADLVARIVAEPLSRAFGQPVVIENKAGGGGTLGGAEVARAAPDGYVLGLATVSSTAANPAVNPRTPYDPIRDFTPLCGLAATPNVIAVHPGFAARGYREFVAELRRHPGRYSHASGGNGAISHIQMELFKSLTATYMTHIPYRGDGPSLQDTVAGVVPVVFGNLPSALPFIQAGRLVPMVVSAPARLAVLPDVPTFQEVGLAPMNRMAYYGLMGPRGLPPEVVGRVHAGAMRVLEDPATVRRIVDTGSIVTGTAPADFARQIREELEMYRRVVAERRIVLE